MGGAACWVTPHCNGRAGLSLRFEYGSSAPASECWSVMSQQTLDYGRPDGRSGVRRFLASRRVRRVFSYVLVVLVCYIGSYVCLSAFGRFQPAVIGAGVNGNSVKWYMWSPAGFHSGYRQRWVLYYIYLPLWTVDRFYWHCEGRFPRGKYPTNTPSTAAEWAEWRGR